MKHRLRQVKINLNLRNVVVVVGSFITLFWFSWLVVFLFQHKIDADTAGRWTLWLTAVAIITATGFSLLQTQAEFQRRRADYDKDQALKYQYLEQQIFKALSDLENHKKVWGHDGVYELLGRVIQVEADHKALLFILQTSGMNIPKPSDNIQFESEQ